MSGIVITFFTEAICERGFAPALFLPDTRLKLIAQLRDKGLQPHPGLGRVPAPRFFRTYLLVLKEDRSHPGVN